MARTDDEVKLLSEVPLFESCSRKELAAIARVAKEVTHGEGTVLAREGDDGVGFFMIKEGSAKVTVGGRSRTRLGPGDFYGEISLLDGGPRSATVTAETDIRLLGLTAWVFKGLIEQHPQIALKMLRVMASRLRGASKKHTD